MSESASDVRLIGEVPRGRNNAYAVTIGTFRTRPFIYVTVVEKTDDDPGPGQPTPRGLSFRPDVLRELLPLFETAIAEAAARGR